jgi:hypothetical protein
VGIFEFPAMAFVCALVSGRPEANASLSTSTATD